MDWICTRSYDRGQPEAAINGIQGLVGVMGIHAFGHGRNSSTEEEEEGKRARRDFWPHRHPQRDCQRGTQSKKPSPAAHLKVTPRVFLLLLLHSG